jgi:hypothetical protein
MANFNVNVRSLLSSAILDRISFPSEFNPGVRKRGGVRDVLSLSKSTCVRIRLELP